MSLKLIQLLQSWHLYGPAKSVIRRMQGFHPAARRRRQRVRNFYAQFIQPGDLCFDVGANLGDRTEAFLNLGARVIAVEPQPKCLQQLQRRFGKRPDVVLVAKALGAKPGEAVMNISEADTISSLSPAWIESVKASGRFAKYQWNQTLAVPVTTLDELLAVYGRPRFCKIDVEGFEFEVLQGLTQPLDVVSFEFTPEYIEAAIRCIRRLAGLGTVRMNYSVGESMSLALPEWTEPERLGRELQDLPDQTVFGDVYVEFTQAGAAANQ